MYPKRHGIEPANQEDIAEAKDWIRAIVRVAKRRRDEPGAQPGDKERDLTKRVFSGRHFRKVTDRTFHVSSAYHVLACLRRPEIMAAEMELPEMHAPTDLDSLLGPCLFRGQEDSTWPLVPSLFRQGIDKNDAEKALKAFEIVTGRWLYDYSQDYSGAYGGLCARAIGQHHGVRTDLLDWSTKPYIALGFACKASKPSPNYPAVLAVPVATARRLGLTIVLPPAMVERLYRQRGVFLQVSEDRARELADASYKLVFPPGRFGIDSSVLLPANAVFDSWIRWARQKASDLRSSSQWDWPEVLKEEADAFAEREVGTDNPVDSLLEGDIFLPEATYVHRQLNLLETLVFSYGAANPSHDLLQWIKEANWDPIKRIETIGVGMTFSANPLEPLIERIKTVLALR